MDASATKCGQTAATNPFVEFVEHGRTLPQLPSLRTCLSEQIINILVAESFQSRTADLHPTTVPGEDRYTRPPNRLVKWYYSLAAGEFELYLANARWNLPTQLERPFMELAKSILRRWKDAGAEVGWVDQWGYFSESKSEDDYLPAFFFGIGNWNPKKLVGLPDPEIPFGLQFQDKAVDSDLMQVAALKSLKSLTLGMTRITDSGVKELASLSNLRTIHLSGCAVGDQSLNYLAKLGSLEFLSLDFTHVTDAGLMNLGTLTALRYLSLNHTHITDAGLKYLAGLTNLRELNLEDTNLVGVGFQHLSALVNLRDICLAGTPITDEGLRNLVVLKGLEDINLWRAKVTDAGIQQLATLKRLRSLHLAQTDITKNAIDALQGALPKCKITG